MDTNRWQTGKWMTGTGVCASAYRHHTVPLAVAPAFVGQALVPGGGMGSVITTGRPKGLEGGGTG